MKNLFFLLPILLLLGGRVYADGLTLSQPYQHDGLIFSSPLSFSSLPENLAPINLEFGSNKITIAQPDNEQDIKIENIVTPTPVNKTTISSSPAQQLPSKQTILPSPPQTTTPTLTTLNSSPNISSGLNADTLFSMVNSYRESRGLPDFQKDDKTCSLAASRAPEIGSEVTSGNMHSGLKSRNLNYWNSENIISMRNETEAFNWWVNDQIHKDAIESNNKYSCIACSENSCAEEFTNYQPK